MIRELAPAKINLVLHVDGRRADGLHELCSLIVPVDLADELTISEASGDDRLICPGVPEPNLCRLALAAFREAAAGSGRLPALEVWIEKRIPVAAGLGGGSADAAALLRAANDLVGCPLDDGALRGVAARVGADVPAQLRPGPALVRGAGELVEPLPLPWLPLVLLPHGEGLSTASVYREADRLRSTRDRLYPERLRALARSTPATLASSLENDLQPAALSLMPGLSEPIAALERAGATRALVTGSGSTVFGAFDDERSAQRAASALPGALAVTSG